MHSRNTKVGTKYLEKKLAYPLNSADINSISQKHPTIHSVDSTSLEQPTNSKGPAISKAALRPNLGRHAAKCQICSHPQREEIEQNFISWVSPAKIAQDFGLHNRSCVYRHSWAVGLFRRRQRNVRAALEKIIEQVGDIEASPSAIVAAIQLYSRINRRGEWIEREDTLDLNELFEQMSLDELKEYAVNETLPPWFKEAIGAAGRRNCEGNVNE